MAARQVLVVLALRVPEVAVGLATSVKAEQRSPIEFSSLLVAAELRTRSPREVMVAMQVVQTGSLAAVAAELDTVEEALEVRKALVALAETGARVLMAPQALLELVVVAVLMPQLLVTEAAVAAVTTAAVAAKQVMAQVTEAAVAAVGQAFFLLVL